MRAVITPVGFRLLGTAAICLLLGGCATPQRILTPADLPKVPRSEGFYGGKLYPSAPWLYQGSTAKYHHFYYTYNHGNRLHSLRILISKSDLALPFEQATDTLPPNGIEVVLIFEEGHGYGFSKPVKANPADSRWLQFPADVPQFNRTLDPLP